MTAMVAGTGAGRRTPDIHVNGRDLTATNDSDGLRRVARLLVEAGAVKAVMEATGRMHRALPQSLHARGFSVPVINPRQARDLPKAAGAFGRTDRVDARIPAAFGAAFPDMEATEPAAAAIDRLRDMPGLRDRPVARRAGTVSGSPEFADSHRILTPVPGIGPVTAAAPGRMDGGAGRHRQPAGRLPAGRGPPSPGTAAPSGAGATSAAEGGGRGTSPA